MPSPQSNGLRWTRFCVASTATALLASAAASVNASQKHALQPGESLDSLARRYHVSVPDLINANHIEDQDRIPDGRVLTIPSPPRAHTVPATMHRTAHISKDKVSIRLGPGLAYRRAEYAYVGDRVTVTSEEEGWAQVALEDGKTGWVLQSLLHMRTGEGGAETASDQRTDRSSTPHPAHKPVHHAAMIALDEDHSRTRKVARRQSSRSAGTHKHHPQHQTPNQKLAHHAKPHKHGSLIAKAEHHVSSSRSHRHKALAEAAVSSHKRHQKHHSIEPSTRIARRHSNGVERHVASARRRHHPIADAGDNGASGDIVRTAYAYRGTPYVWGGERPGGFDCSGFTMHLYGKKGISLPHSARAQFQMGHKVDRSGMKPGDLVFFHTVTPGISHVGMYVGNGNFVHASSRRSGGVRVDCLDSSYYSKAYRGARRMR